MRSIGYLSAASSQSPALLQKGECCYIASFLPLVFLLQAHNCKKCISNWQYQKKAKQIFAVEKSLKEQPAAERQKQRDLHIRPLLQQYWSLLESFEAEKDTNLYKAQKYSLNQKPYLDAVLLDGRLELTNNLAERTVKPFVMARKNFLFCDTAKGADSSALCFSIIETAKRNGLDPFAYLLYLLGELPKLGEQPTEKALQPLLPWAKALPKYCRK